DLPASRRTATPRAACRGSLWRAAALRGRCRSSEGEELDAAADVQPDARDVRREVGAEERDRVRHVLRLAGAAERGAPDHPLVHLRVAELEGLRADHAGNDRIARDPVPGALE